ncbi:Na+ dependent nucleoside transporter N-terminal domain-containing protein, partial [Francisella tularensis]|uniref:Na+ dependent nucleoside transporter N-terminal domain-containing protein n=1 Tax=Francisella tularensis TaxID=263 RepID=UPI002381956A
MFVMILYLLLGLVTVFLLALFWRIFSKNIKYKLLFIILFFQLLVCFFLLQYSEGIKLVAIISSGFDNILQHAHEGTA